MRIFSEGVNVGVNRDFSARVRGWDRSNGYETVDLAREIVKKG